MPRAVPLIETVDDLESMAIEERTDLYEFNDSGETEKNLLAHEVHSSDEEMQGEDEEFDDLPRSQNLFSVIKG